MIILYKKNPIVGYAIFSLLCSLVTAFFIYQIFKSNTLLEIQANKKTLATKLEKYDHIKGELLQYNEITEALSPHSVDVDFLEEEARKKLLYTRDNEIILFRRAGE